jgi:hypothetical protein
MKNYSRLKNRPRPRQAQRAIEDELFEFLYFQMMTQEPIKVSKLVDFVLKIQNNVCNRNKLATLLQKLMIFPPPIKSSQKVSRNFKPRSSSPDSRNEDSSNNSEENYDKSFCDSDISRNSSPVPVLAQCTVPDIPVLFHVSDQSCCQLIGTQASLHQTAQEETENPAQRQLQATEIPTLTGNPAHSSGQSETKLEIQETIEYIVEYVEYSVGNTVQDPVDNNEEDPVEEDPEEEEQENNISNEENNISFQFTQFIQFKK